MTVLSLTTDKDATVWKGLVLIFCLFVMNILATASFVSGSTIGHITGARFCRQSRCFETSL